MTEAQAHKFVTRWQRLFVVDRKRRMEIEIIGQLQLRMIILVVNSSLFAFADSFRFGSSFFWNLTEVIFLLMLGFGLLMNFRLWQAQRALNQSQILNG